MIRPELKIFLDVQSLYAQAARDIENIAINSITSRGSAQIALSGGNTPKQLYAILDKSGRVPWDRVDFFLSDERMVPLTDSQSNYQMIKSAMPQAKIHPMNTDAGDPSWSADLYQEEITQFVPGGDNETPPAFDLILLGLGVNGHTASLFPHIKLSDNPKKWVETFFIPEVEMNRISFLPRLINAAQNIFVIIAGAEKASIAQKVMNESGYPMNLIAPQSGRYFWFLDQAASQYLAKAA